MDELEAATRMHLCFVTPTYPEPNQAVASGVATAVRALALALTARGHCVHVVTLSRTARPDAHIEGVAVHYVPIDQTHWYLSKLPLVGRFLALPLREFEHARRLARHTLRLHQARPFDVIEATETGALFLSLRRGLPLVLRLHGEEYTFRKHTPGLHVGVALRLTRYLQRIALRRAEALISPSAAHAKEIVAELGPPPRRIEVVPHVLPQIVPATYVRTPPQPIVLFVGRLEQRKGIFDAFAGFVHVLKAVPEARLIVLGGNHPTVPEVAVHSEIQRLGLEGSVELHGSVTPQVVAEWYQRARVLLMPSFYETFGLAALEALAHGLPVVAYNVSAIPEVIGTEAGICVRPSDVEGLSEAVRRLLCDDVLWQRMSANAIRRAAYYQNAHQVEDTLAVYARVAQRR